MIYYQHLIHLFKEITIMQLRVRYQIFQLEGPQYFVKYYLTLIVNDRYMPAVCGNYAYYYCMVSYILGHEDVFKGIFDSWSPIYTNCVFVVGSNHFAGIYNPTNTQGQPYSNYSQGRHMLSNNPRFQKRAGTIIYTGRGETIMPESWRIPVMLPNEDRNLFHGRWTCNHDNRR